MDEQFVLTFLTYALLLKDGTGTVFLQNGEDIWLPLFTDDDAVRTYLERSEIKECIVLELSTPTLLGSFLRNPPSRSGLSDVRWVIIDPVESGQRNVTLFTLQQLLASLPA